MQKTLEAIKLLAGAGMNGPGMIYARDSWEGMFYTSYRMWKWPNAEIDVLAREKLDDEHHVISVQFAPWRKRKEVVLPVELAPVKELEPA